MVLVLLEFDNLLSKIFYFRNLCYIEFFLLLSYFLPLVFVFLNSPRPSISKSLHGLAASPDRCRHRLKLQKAKLNYVLELWIFQHQPNRFQQLCCNNRMVLYQISLDVYWNLNPYVHLTKFDNCLVINSPHENGIKTIVIIDRLN